MSTCDDDISVFESSLSSFKDTQQDLSSKLLSSQKRLEDDFKALDDCIKSHAAQLTEYHQLKDMFLEVKRHHENNDDMKKKLEEYELTLESLRISLDKLRDTAPRFDSQFVRFMMGRVSVKMWKHAEQLHFRNEYDKFKWRTTFFFILFPLVQLFIYSSRFLWITHQGWLIYYYITLALRENILQANGSSIQNWWIYHHYISLIVCITGTFWPTTCISSNIKLFLGFGLVQGLVMLVQNWYQANRAYARKALEKQKVIDCDTSETLVEKPTNLILLIPLLFIVYVFEFVLSMFFLFHYFYPLPEDGPEEPWQKLVFAISFLILCLGNTATTISILLSKKQQRWFARLRQSHRQMMKKTMSIKGLAFLARSGK